MSKLFRPEGMNIELTTCCPLRCPQCYCSLEGGIHIPLKTAVRAIEQAASMGVRHVELSGGETLCYPHLYEVIKAASQNGLSPNIAISGWNLSDETLDKLIEAGIEGIFVSLNAPNPEINALTRDGYELAIQALELLQRRDYQDRYINWVMHRSNADLFPEMIALAEQYQVTAISIIAPKPTAAHELKTYPTAEQMYQVADQIKRYKGSVQLFVESCFSPMLALVGRNKFWGNTNRGPYKGCGAGRFSLSVNVYGQFSPCRHLEYFESWDSMEAYWMESPVLQRLRETEEQKQEPCRSCSYGPNCRHCMAYNSKVNHDIYLGSEICPLAQEQVR